MLGQRYAKTVGGVTTVFHYDKAGATAAFAQQAYYIYPDHLNTPRAIEDQAQQLVWRWENRDPFGANLPDEDPSSLGNFTCNLRLPGQYYDVETGQHYNYFRDYSPETGRYIQSDPIGLAGGINTYAYVYNNPVLFFDALGLDVRVCYFPRGAHGLGHVGIGPVGGLSTQGFYPENPKPGSKMLTGTPGTVMEDPRDPSIWEDAICKTIPATSDQDSCIERCIKDRASNPGTYKLLSRQCTSFPRDCLTECMLPAGDPDTPYPDSWYKSLPAAQYPYIPIPDVNVPNGFAF